MVRAAFVLMIAALGIAGSERARATLLAQQPTFRAETDLVNFAVTVTDRRGNFITDLTRDDFEIVEDGKAQSIRVFARGDASVGLASNPLPAELTPELHLGMLLDTSGSMGEDIGLARSAAVKFLNTLNDAQDMTLVDFDTEVRVGRYGQGDFPRMVERIRARKPGGFTAMYDALGVYLDGASDDDGRTILVVFTDGGDTRSSINFSDALTLLRASDVTVYTIGFLEHQSTGSRFEQRQRLTQIAAETGGEAFFPLTMKEVSEAYDRILAQIRAQYSLGFVSANASADGRWRKVEIRVRRPGLKDARVRSRKGYFAPYRP